MNRIIANSKTNLEKTYLTPELLNFESIFEKQDLKKNIKTNIPLKNECQGINSKKELLLESLLKFYDDDYNRKILISIINQETTISLRLLDWLVTNYSKKNNIHYILNDIKTSDGYIPSSVNFNLWLDYKNHLKAFSKKVFDPFNRRQRVYFDFIQNKIFPILNNNKLKEYETFLKCEKNKHSTNPSGLITTIGQLNFFKWAIENKVIDYAFENLELIEQDMLKSIDNTDNTDNNSNKLKKQISKNKNTAKSQNLKVIISFN